MTATSSISQYDHSFFEVNRRGSSESAEAILPIVFDLVKPRSVVDVGCGVGTWLKVATDLGAEHITGFDGAYVDARQLHIPAGDFEPADLEQKLPGVRADLVMSLEVAEHLSPARARSFVRELTEIAPVVLFSAAIPLQRGLDHRNERWQDEWEEDFRRNRFTRLDPVRPAVWDRTDIPAWYAQNVLLYVSDDRLKVDERLRAVVGHGFPSRVVHPRLWELRNTTPGLGEAIRTLPRSLGSTMNKRLGRGGPS